MAAAYVGDRGSTNAALISSAASTTVTVTGSPAPKNVLVMEVSASGAGQAVTSVTDTRGNTWTVFAYSGATLTAMAICWTQQNAGTLLTGDTITVNITPIAAATQISCLVQEFSGLGEGYLGASATSSTFGAAQSTGPVTSTFQYGVAVNVTSMALIATFSSPSWSIPTANTLSGTNGTSESLFTQYLLLTAPTTATASVTASASGNGGGIVIVLGSPSPSYIASLGRRPVPMIQGPDTDAIMRMYRRG